MWLNWISFLGDETVNRVIFENERKRTFEFKPRTAEDLLTTHHTLRMDVSKECGEKAFYLFDRGAILEKALIDYTLHGLKCEEGFRQLMVPDVLNTQTPVACGLTSKSDSKLLFTLKTNADYCLAGTAEMGIASYLEDEILNVDQLPLKFVAVSRCYRPEISSSNIQKGLYRVHEFTKVRADVQTNNE